jgi:hypothetical protein
VINVGNKAGTLLGDLGRSILPHSDKDVHDVLPLSEKSGIFAGFFAEKNGMTNNKFSCILLLVKNESTRRRT